MDAMDASFADRQMSAGKASSTETRLTVSVVITAYNHAHYIAEALESVVSQDMKPDEIILVDDGSTDETVRIAESFKRYGVQIVTRKNGGPSQAFNQGSALTTGDVLVFFSGDDVMTEGSINLRVRTLASGHCDIVCSPPVWIAADGRELSMAEHPPLFSQFEELRPAQMFTRLYYSGNYICAPSVAMTRACWAAAGPLNPELFQLQDYDIWLRASGLGMKFTCLAEPCVRYRWHGRNLSTRNATRSVMEFESIWLDAPERAKQEILMEVMFGKGLADLETSLTIEDLAMLIKAKHRNSMVSQNGHKELNAAFHEPDRALRLKESIF
jgi:glycosyltransferase involved in cell wall biosynthesis